ncbi:MAG: hypothetical protein ACYDH6_10360 [Acidimicrobiales bacterium]
MDRVAIALGLFAVASVVAVVLGRRRPQPPTQAKVAVPAQLDRADFPDADRPWLVSVWTSLTCASCEAMTAKARLLSGDEVAYVEIPWQERRDLHDRYHITDVPLLLLADADGVVRVSFVGTPELGELYDAVAEARQQAAR